ncbi:hypothetical protein STEG23_022768, partial [Scotinomys teguina]
FLVLHSITTSNGNTEDKNPLDAINLGEYGKIQTRIDFIEMALEKQLVLRFQLDQPFHFEALVLHTKSQLRMPSSQLKLRGKLGLQEEDEGS